VGTGIMWNTRESLELHIAQNSTNTLIFGIFLASQLIESDSMMAWSDVKFPISFPKCNSEVEEKSEYSTAKSCRIPVYANIIIKSRTTEYKR